MRHTKSTSRLLILTGGIVIERAPRAGGVTLFTVWEQTKPSPGYAYGHSAITHFDDLHGTYGGLGTRNLPEHLNALPARSKERIEAVRQWREEQYAEAYRIIIESFPEAAAGSFMSGEIAL